jgi:CheY-like chemotaxis protein
LRKLNGKIVVAEDQAINVEILKGYFETLRLVSDVTICINGQEAIDKCCNIINESLMEAILTEGATLKPISLCLLDFQMPIKNGIQVVKEVKAHIKSKNNQFPHVNIEEPIFVFLTAFMTSTFNNHLKSLGITECYEKPIEFL